MELNIQELAELEIQSQVKEKLGSKLHLEIQKEMKKYDYKHDISLYVDNGLKVLLNNTDLLDLIDKDKLQQDVTNIVAKELLKRMTTNYRYEDEDVDYFNDY